MDKVKISTCEDYFVCESSGFAQYIGITLNNIDTASVEVRKSHRADELKGSTDEQRPLRNTVDRRDGFLREARRVDKSTRSR